MKPTDKSPEVERKITEMFGIVRKSHIRANICVSAPIGCGLPATEFRDEPSRREYALSGLCQSCQDRIFGV